MPFGERTALFRFNFNFVENYEINYLSLSFNPYVLGD